ncbi:MAG TPA: hypothetical protein VHX68_05950 [Planctomycetaceae bacterium]|jgi:hypothetical protein|nr:hypothetical protein [Planctomycetaceae bacterium]
MRRVWPDLAIGALFGCLVLAGGGCGNSQRLDRELLRIGQVKATVFPFAGKVLVDGQTPQLSGGQKIVVVLFDAAKPNLPVRERPQALCNHHGEFAFATYGNADGLVAGDYVVTIAQLFCRSKDNACEGPDGFKNLYNDPDQNSKLSTFAIKHGAPGKTNYVFDVELASHDPVNSPGPRAVTAILAD